MSKMVPDIMLDMILREPFDLMTTINLTAQRADGPGENPPGRIANGAKGFVAQECPGGNWKDVFQIKELWSELVYFNILFQRSHLKFTLSKLKPNPEQSPNTAQDKSQVFYLIF